MIVLAGGTLSTVPAAGGSLTTLATAPGGRRFWYPQFVSDGRAIIYTSSMPRPDGGDIEVLDIASKTSRKLLPGVGGAAAADGTPRVHSRRQPVGGEVRRRRACRFRARRCPSSKESASRTAGAVQYSVARDGTLMYIPGACQQRRMNSCGSIARARRSRLAFLAVRSSRSRLDPTGRRVALDVRDQGRQRDIWVLSLGRQTPTRVTFDPAEDTLACVDAGRTARVRARRVTTPLGLYWQAADGTGAAQKIVGDPGGHRSGGRDTGRQAVVAESGEDIVIVDFDGKSGDAKADRGAVQGAESRGVAQRPLDRVPVGRVGRRRGLRAAVS